jgi:hypothetical protein
MTPLLKELAEAYEENIKASKAVINAQLAKSKAHYNLLNVKDRIRIKEREIFEDELNNHDQTSL